jgi:hypothetical protein
MKQKKLGGEKRRRKSYNHQAGGEISKQRLCENIMKKVMKHKPA